MALSKVTYTDDVTIIEAANLNDIQDEIINNCVSVEAQSFVKSQKDQARTNLGLSSTTIAGGSIAVNDTISLGDLVFKVTGIV